MISSFIQRITIIGTLFGMLMLALPALAQSADDVTFTADTVSSNAETGIMTATGNVVIVQGKMELRADRVDYDRESGTAEATGNVILTDHMGGVHYAENLKLEESFSKAFAEPVISKLVDGSWVGAASVVYEADTLSSFDTARFTPCDCDFKNGATPAWELQSGETQHDPKTATVYHKNVTMRLASIPILYMPYLSHPDWTVRRRSGIMPPRVSYSSDLGTTYSQSYYWVTGDTHDTEISPYIFTNNGDAVQLRYRQRWDEADFNAVLTGGRLNTFKKNREDVVAIDASFSTIIGDDWLTTARLYRSSQDTFMRRYGFDRTETLKTHLTTQQIGRDRYSLIEAYDIQDLRNSRSDEQEPNILPHIFHERYLDAPRDGMDLRLRLSATSINNDEYTDVRRWTSELYGIEEFDTDFGIFSAEGRFSGQYRDIETATNNSGYTGELGQASASAGIGWSMPLSTVLADRPVVFEPRVKFVTVEATDRSAKIPNRDSADFRLDEANLFLLHREQGEDYAISHSRVDTGVSVNLYDDLLGDISGFVGSSFRVSGNTPDGLNALEENDRISDILASATIEPDDIFSLSLSGRFHPRDLTLNETKVAARVSYGGTSVTTSYNQLAKSYFDAADEEKEELKITAQQKLPNNWSASWTQVYDLRNDTRDLTDSKFTLNYGGGIQDCLTISIGYARDATTDRDIQPVDEVFLLFTFKYLGSFSTNEVKR